MSAYDVCVIGSGAGGAPVAAALAEAGLSVVLLEKGPWLRREHFLRDEIQQVQRNTLVPDPRQDPHVQEVRDFAGRTWVDERSQEAWNGVLVGGASNLMSGFFLRMKPVDFRQRSELGPVDGADVVDWPIGYDDLEPYYDRVEKELGVSGRVVPHKHADRRSSPEFPLRPLRAHPIARELDGACAALGLTSVPLPRAVLSKDVGERGECGYSGMCGSYGCPTGAKGSALEGFVGRALATGRCELRPRTQAVRLASDVSGRVRFAEVRGPGGGTERVEAGLFVVACNPVETARLLLLSTGPRHPRGLANGSGRVGQTLLSTTFGAGHGELSYAKHKQRWPWIDSSEPWINRCVQDFYVIDDPVLGRRKGGTIDFLRAHPQPIGAAWNVATAQGRVPLWGTALKRQLEHWFRGSLQLRFEIFAEMLPFPGSRVTLDPRVKDAWGAPAARTTWVYHPRHKETAGWLIAQGERILTQLGAEGVGHPPYGGESSNLLAGTCRFGDDPAASVLDRDCRAHEVDNLYVTDGSFMPTVPAVPFTFTLYANALRVADRILVRLGRRAPPAPAPAAPAAPAGR